ncbi:uncharacterized protein LOC126983951 isoform X2 [Eriocheir sinensis]|uniref:uncharacterized protein LOC126983951 isoform X2 n=1 Tax=Eriocheir sinensis TaxID=95602 RepID=UPI0021C5AA6B|nr:uncharacterized protein LOC126983951 isoform X2 [Eriocheir sinensis]
MTQTLKMLLVVACVVSLRPVLAAAERDADGAVEVAEPRYVTHTEKSILGAFLGQLLTHWLLILEAWYLILGIFAPAWSKRSLSWSLQDWLAPASPEGAEMGFLERAMNRIDPVDTTFSLLRVNEKACRQRVVCELQRSASALPVIGDFLQQISSSIPGLQEYREAQEAGAALEDCSLLFADCSEDGILGD